MGLQRRSREKQFLSLNKLIENYIIKTENEIIKDLICSCFYF
jgi:hypothetical protein